MLREKLDRFGFEIDVNLAAGALAAMLPVVDSQGSHPVVVALGEERLSALMNRVRRIGGFANVFVRDEGGVAALAFIDRGSALGADDAENLTSESDRPGPNATVSMFLSYLALKPHGVLLPADVDGDRPVVRQPRRVELA